MVENMTSADKRKKLTSELLKVKAEGLRVFINIPNENEYNYYNYGFITDGKNIIYVQFSDYGSGFTTTFEYVPSKKCGSGCRTLESGYEYKNLSKEVFLEAVECGRRNAIEYGAEFYKDFEHFFKDDWRKKTYIEL